MFLDSTSVRLGTGHPRVGKSKPIPVPANTVPVAGTGAQRTCFAAVLYETHGIWDTRGFIPLQSSTNLIVTSRKQCAHINRRGGTFREVLRAGGGGEGG